jgi:hypothetical protein
MDKQLELFCDGIKGEEICLAYCTLIELALAKGLEEAVQKGLTNNLGSWVEKDSCWETDIGEHYHVWLNPHLDIKRNVNGFMMDVDPLCAYVEYMGYPFAFMSPMGGVMGSREDANEDAFIQETREEISKTKGLRTTENPGSVSSGRSEDGAPLPS